MKKRLLFFVFLLFTISSTFCQQENKTIDKEGEVFYSTIEKTAQSYNINIDIFELHGTEYIEVELYNSEEVKLVSDLAKLRFKDNKFFITRNSVESEVTIEDINLTLQNIDNSIDYPKIMVKLLDQNYSVVDYSQKTFY